MLAWFRSWPEVVPEGRAYIHDSLPRLLMRDCDYRTANLPLDLEPGFCMLEWDVALSYDQRQNFARLAHLTPERVLVAPYRIYPVGRRDGVVVHKAALDESKMAMRISIPPGQSWAHSFGFGCIYFPSAVLRRWMTEKRGAVMRDNTFSDWHIARYGRVLVDWSTHPQHLHGD